MRLNGRHVAPLTNCLSQTDPFDTLCVPILTELVSRVAVSPYFMVDPLTKLVSATSVG